MRAWGARSRDNPAVINRIMLRFRPIAPKPVGDQPASGAAVQSRTDLTGRRVKRKYVRTRGRQSKRRPRSKVLDGGKLPSPPEKSGVEDAPPPEKGSVTLQLLGERSESESKICDISVPKSEEKRWEADLCSVTNGVSYMTAADYVDGGRSVIETWIIMERVTDKFEGVGLGFSDKEKICNLERDTCPGFVSDWTNSVIWMNPAYKKMVAEDEAAAAEKGFLVWLVVKEQLPRVCPSFACRVRVTQHKGQGQKWNKILPCDVWRMEFGGFAWKLDVNTALSLGF
ncbi:hypothetical protein C2S51_007086 [Perilla frutescens var. frutescens]|nr:hypothetical protein C2S51_007086 [Perilla frutescens var. frutescens]